MPEKREPCCAAAPFLQQGAKEHQGRRSIAAFAMAYIKAVNMVRLQNSNRAPLDIAPRSILDSFRDLLAA